MIKVNFDPKTLTGDRKKEWDEWSARAEAATEKIIGQWESWKDSRREWEKKREGKAPEFDPNFDNTVWAGFKDWLLKHVFHNKCAYCETPVIGFLGDAEHFRPKGRVRDTKVIDHPGYFWLAYHWKNLLPACEICNRYSGKKDLFPVRKTHVAVSQLTIKEIDDLIYRMRKSQQQEDIFYLEPDDLDRIEERLLLHPYEDEPEQFIHFQVGGIAAPWEDDPRAEASINVYDLNNQQKIMARGREQRDGLKRYFNLLSVVNDEDEEMEASKTAARALKKEYYEGWRPYAVATFDYIHFKLAGSGYDPDVLLGPRRTTNAD